MSTETKCLGCGSVLQNTSETLSGYVTDLHQTYCQSCYKLKNYGIATDHFHPDSLPVLKPKSLIVMVSSVMHLDMLFSYRVDRYYPNEKYLYIINQMDLLPKSTNLDYLMNEITKKARSYKIPYEDIIFMSAIKKADIESLKDYLLSYRQENIYLLGVQNSGKTTIFKGLTHNKTALNMKKAALTQTALCEKFENKFLWDMPGLFQMGYLHQIMSYEKYKLILPEKTLRPIIYQIEKSQSIIIDGLIALNYLKGEKQSFVFYFNPIVKYHKTNITKTAELLENKTVQFNNYATSYETKTFKLEKKIKYQVTFADMGLLHLEGPATIEVIHAKNMHVTLMEAMFK